MIIILFKLVMFEFSKITIFSIIYYHKLTMFTRFLIFLILNICFRKGVNLKTIYIKFMYFSIIIIRVYFYFY